MISVEPFEALTAQAGTIPNHGTTVNGRDLPVGDLKFDPLNWPIGCRKRATPFSTSTTCEILYACLIEWPSFIGPPIYDNPNVDGLYNKSTYYVQKTESPRNCSKTTLDKSKFRPKS